ncbi:MAG: GTPase Era [Chloroflexi bacterium]|nr:GTPase Era [Chloroflexota bacterium]
MDVLIPESLPEDHRSGFVALVGRPNVGKSTLMNAYLGQKIAIVSEKPQTTRQRILGVLTEPHYQIVFVDTPGIHTPHHRLGEYMVTTARRALKDADVILWLVDGSVPPTPDDESIGQILRDAAKVPVILAVNKIDLVREEDWDGIAAPYLALANVHAHALISATRGDNRDRLLEMIVEALPLGPRYFPEEQVTDQDERFLAAELIREQVLRECHQEVPHSVAVIVDEFKDRSDDLSYISATIAVERESQKQIVIGRGGSMLKRIGQGARLEIEKALGRRVYLELWVKVLPKWRRDPALLKRLGYVLPPEADAD